MRKVKCKICKNEILKSEAYLIEDIKTDANGKEKVTRKYYCSEKEYLDYKYENECKDKFFKKLEELFGSKVINTYLFKLYAELKDYKHSNILDTLIAKENDISHAIRSTIKNGSQTNKLQYVFAIIKNTIEDNKTRKNHTITVQDSFESDFDEVFETMTRIRKTNNRRRSIRDIIRDKE